MYKIIKNTSLRCHITIECQLAAVLVGPKSMSLMRRILLAKSHHPAVQSQAVRARDSTGPKSVTSCTTWGAAREKLESSLERSASKRRGAETMEAKLASVHAVALPFMQRGARRRPKLEALKCVCSESYVARRLASHFARSGLAVFQVLPRATG